MGPRAAEEVEEEAGREEEAREATGKGVKRGARAVVGRGRMG